MAGLRRWVGMQLWIAVLLGTVGVLLGERAIATEPPTNPGIAEANSTTPPPATDPSLHPSLILPPSPATTLREWQAQIAQFPVRVTDVQLQAGEEGVTLTLITENGVLPIPEPRTLGNALIVDIANATLENAFSEANPTEGIALIEVTSLPGDQVRVAITGTDAPPVAEVRSEGQSLVFGVARGTIAAEDEDEIEIVVTGDQEDYYVPDASVGTRTDTPLRDVPASIQVVPRQVIDDRGVTILSNALETTSGVNPENYGGGYSFYPRIRGFTGFNSVFVNGSRRTVFNSGFENPNIDNIERIEVLRGPSSVLFGQGSPGGIINLVTRRPLEDPYYSFTLQGGSFSQIRPSFDISGPLTSDDTLLYRFIGSYTRERSFVEFANSEIYFLAPSLEWRISPSTNLAVDLEFVDSSIAFICGIPAVGDGVADIPRSRAICESGDFGDLFNKTDLQRYSVSARLEHQFSQDWTARNTLFFTTYNLRSAGPNPSDFNENTGELQRQVGTIDNSFTSFSNNLDVVGSFSTGSVDHRLLLGFEYTRQNGFRNFFFGGEYPSINIFDPEYSDVRFQFDSFPFTVRREQPNTAYGFYLQDQISFTDNLILLLGGRYDIYEQETINRITDVSSGQTFYAFSPRVGLVYRPVEPLSLYASFTRGFEPSSAVLADASDPDPQQSTQYEVGAKLEFGDLAATLAYFDITRTNIPTTDPDNQEFSILTGEARSRGVELDLTGEILPGWNITASYAYTDAFVSEDNTTPVGNRLVFTPRHSAALWTTYEIQEGDVQGLGFGLGLFYVGEREADIENSFSVPSYFRTDASIFYRRDNWRAQINFQNIFNTEYFVGTNEFRAGGVMPGAPFSVVGSVSITF